jgi:two-component system, chemotaxis family, protein-glutamate methylesterase/glutaminase
VARNHDIVVIGTSAGGVQALQQLASGLPRDLPAAVMIVLHLPGDFRSELPEVIARSGPLPAAFAKDYERIEHARIYIAPPDHHLLVYGDTLRLGHGARENHARPAIDPMFRSAAVCCGPRTVGLVLTGYLHDGTSGLNAVKRCGGITVVQDPADAAFPEMPRNAMAATRADHVVRLAEMPELLRKLVRLPEGKSLPVPEDIQVEADTAISGQNGIEQMEKLGNRSVLACPDCHGVLWEIHDGELIRYRCHVGHAYTEEALELSLQDDLSRALGSALRALEDRTRLLRQMERQAKAQDHNRMAQTWGHRADQAEAEAEVIRRTMGRL